MDSPDQKTSPNPDQKPKIKETLEPGQNFYDQIPFQRVITEAAASTATDISRLRGALTSIARLGATKQNSGALKGEDLTPEQLSQKVNSPHDLDVKDALGNARIYKSTNPEYVLALRTIVDKLKRYPLWHNYITEQLPGFYNNDGTPREIPTAKAASAQPDSYTKYFLTKTKASRAAFLKGIEEVFDQKATSLAQGKSPTARQWAQRKAAETTKD